MGKVSAFNFVTLDGYFEGPKRDISWHKHDADGTAYAVEGLMSGNALLFGRVALQPVIEIEHLQSTLTVPHDGVKRRQQCGM